MKNDSNLQKVKHRKDAVQLWGPNDESALLFTIQSVGLIFTPSRA